MVSITGIAIVSNSLNVFFVSGIKCPFCSRYFNGQARHFIGLFPLLLHLPVCVWAFNTFCTVFYMRKGGCSYLHVCKKLSDFSYFFPAVLRGRGFQLSLCF
jgi:hypothetical protein